MQAKVLVEYLVRSSKGDDFYLKVNDLVSVVSCEGSFYEIETNGSRGLFPCQFLEYPLHNNTAVPVSPFSSHSLDEDYPITDNSLVGVNIIAIEGESSEIYTVTADLYTFIFNRKSYYPFLIRFSSLLIWRIAFQLKRNFKISFI